MKTHLFSLLFIVALMGAFTHKAMAFTEVTGDTPFDKVQIYKINPLHPEIIKEGKCYEIR